MQEIKNIIFDLGGVLLNIDYHKTVSEFEKIGVEKFDSVYTQFSLDRIAELFEKGLISDDDFRNHIRNYSGLKLTDDEIDTAWKSMLLDFPPHRIDLLKELNNNYRLFILSNTNNIHYREVKRIINALTYPVDFDDLFEKTYYSHLVHLRKPEQEIFELVLNENNLQSAETLFIDDSPQHTQTAKTLGIHVIDLGKGVEVGAEINRFLKTLF